VDELLFSSSQSYILGKSNAKNCDMHYSSLPVLPLAFSSSVGGKLEIDDEGLCLFP